VTLLFDAHRCKFNTLKADLVAFAAVSAQRVGKNLPPHVPVGVQADGGTSLAGSLLKDKP
jgi:hypothetical protein